MNILSTGRKITSFVCLVAGIIMFIAALVMDFSGSESTARGPLLIIGALLLIAGAYFFPSLKHHRAIVYVLFLFPLLFTFAVTVIIPMLLGFYYSFTNWDGIRMTSFVGFENYIKMFHSSKFLWSILITFLFVIFNMILVNLVGFLLALLCTTKIKGMGFFRASYFLPNLIGGIVLGYIWQFIFANVLTEMLNQKYSWLASTHTAFLAIVVVYVWQYAGYIMLIYITGLTTVPRDVLEASAIDGANAVQTLFKIKMPMIASTFTICTFLTLTSAFKQFDVNLSLTGGTGSVTFLGDYLSNGTQMLALNIYSTAVNEDNYALGQAKAILFFIILATVSIIQVRISNKKEVEM